MFPVRDYCASTTRLLQLFDAGFQPGLIFANSLQLFYSKHNAAMEDDYMYIGRLIFTLLESLSIIETTKNVETLLTRYHLALTVNSMLCHESSSPEYVAKVQIGLENYKAHFLDKILTDIHTYILTYPCQPYLQMLCYGAILRGFATHYAEQMIAVNELKGRASKIKRLKKLCLIIDKVKKEIAAIELVDQKGILNADEALSSVEKVKRQVEAAINEIVLTRRKK